MKSAAALLGLATIAFSSAALHAQNVADASEHPTKRIKERKICRRQDQTGSLLGASTCYTAAQWVVIDGRKPANPETNQSPPSAAPDLQD